MRLETPQASYNQQQQHGHTRMKQGIDDGFLAPFKVIRVDLNHDLQGWRPEAGMVDDNGNLIDDRVYNQKDFDKAIKMCNDLMECFEGQMSGYYNMWIERCEFMKTQSLPKDWNGVFIATTK